MEALTEWGPLAIDSDLLSAAYKIHGRYGLSWWDSLIVAAGVHSDCDEILSEDVSSEQVYEGIPVINPFV